MSAAADRARGEELRIDRYAPSDIDELMAIELRSFTAPWSRESYEELAPLEFKPVRGLKGVKAEFFTASTRPPAVYRGI